MEPMELVTLKYKRHRRTSTKLRFFFLRSKKANQIEEAKEPRKSCGFTWNAAVALEDLKVGDGRDDVGLEELLADDGGERVRSRRRVGLKGDRSKTKPSKKDPLGTPFEPKTTPADVVRWTGHRRHCGQTFKSQALPGPAWNTISRPPAPQASKLMKAPICRAHCRSIDDKKDSINIHYGGGKLLK